MTKLNVVASAYSFFGGFQLSCLSTTKVFTDFMKMFFDIVLFLHLDRYSFRNCFIWWEAKL